MDPRLHLLAVVLMSLPGCAFFDRDGHRHRGDDRDCRFAEDECAAGFACVEDAGDWICVAESNDTGRGEVGEADASADAETGFQTYHYLLIEDEAQNASGDRPGAAIDGVVLTSRSGTYYLSQIHEGGFGQEQPNGNDADFDNALGEPEDQCQGLDADEWNENTFISNGIAIVDVTVPNLPQVPQN